MMSSEAKDEKSNLIAANECCGCLMTVTADFKVVNPGRAPNAAKGEDYPTYCIDGKSLNLIEKVVITLVGPNADDELKDAVFSMRVNHSDPYQNFRNFTDAFPSRQLGNCIFRLLRDNIVHEMKAKDFNGLKSGDVIEAVYAGKKYERVVAIDFDVCRVV